MWQYLIIGIIQGIAEWIPISSEGVVAITSHLLHLKPSPLQLALFLHLGTGLAALIYFRREWLKILKLQNPRLLRFFIITTVVSLVVAFPLYQYLSLAAIGPILLLITGVGLLFTAFFQRYQPNKNVNFRDLSWLGGLAQGLAVIPGFSRSGGTIFTLSWGRLNPTEVLKISYMMAMPVSLGAGFYLLFFESTSLMNISGLIALAASFIIGLVTLKMLISISRRINFFWFALTFALLCFGGYFLQIVF